MRLTPAQKNIVRVMKLGGYIWHPYIRSHGPAYLCGTGVMEYWDVQYRTIDRLCDLGVLEEVEDDVARHMGDNDGDVRYKLATFQHFHALLCTDGYEGRTETGVLITGETSKRYTIKALKRTKLAGRDRWLEIGQTAIVPKTAIRKV